MKMVTKLPIKMELLKSFVSKRAININHFMPYDRFIERMDEFILSIKDSDLASGVDQIYLPGEKGSIRYKARLKEGIPLDSPTIETLSAMAKELGIEGIPGKI